MSAKDLAYTRLFESCLIMADHLRQIGDKTLAPYISRLEAVSTRMPHNTIPEEEAIICEVSSILDADPVKNHKCKK